MDRVGGYARDNPMLTGGIAGGLAGLLLGRGFGGDLLKYGGMAVIGGLAYKAYRDYQASQQAVASAGGGYGKPRRFLATAGQFALRSEQCAAGPDPSSPRR